MRDSRHHKFILTINNPGTEWSHERIKDALGSLQLAYWCMSDEIGLQEHTPHTHLYFVAKTSAIRFSTVKALFPTAHIEPARGSSTANRDYVRKEGKWLDNEKHETSIPDSFEEGGVLTEEKPGYRSDLDEIAAMLDEGMTPSQIMAENFAYRRYERMIRSAFFDKRRRETPTKRDVQVHYLVGESGSGKTHTYVTLCEEHGEDEVYFFSDFDGGGFDEYQGEKILVLDEMKGQLAFATLLLLTDSYKAQVHARFRNVHALWREVYITSIFPPDELYQKMVEEGRRGRDKLQQLLRRITDITYCYVDDNGEYKRYTIPMSQYKDYDTLKRDATKRDATLPDWVKEAEEADEIDPLPL